MRAHPFSLKHFSLTLWSDLPLIGPHRRAVAEIQPFITKSELDSQALWREQVPPKGNCPILFSEEMNHHLELLLPLCWLQREPWVTSSVTNIYIIYLIYRFLNVYIKADESHSMSLARAFWGGCCRLDVGIHQGVKPMLWSPLSIYKGSFTCRMEEQDVETEN